MMTSEPYECSNSGRPLPYLVPRAHLENTRTTTPHSLLRN